MAPAQMQFMIPVESKQRLIGELGYYPDEVAVMDPALAMSVLKRGLKRPWGGAPMPENWKSKSHQMQTGREAGGGRGRLVTWLVVAVGAAAAGVVWWRAEEEARRKEEARRRAWARGRAKHGRPFLRLHVVAC
eukprot:jgi/Tetstr1/462200/TSEL_007263.t1